MLVFLPILRRNGIRQVVGSKFIIRNFSNPPAEPAAGSAQEKVCLLLHFKNEQRLTTLSYRKGLFWEYIIMKIIMNRRLHQLPSDTMTN